MRLGTLNFNQNLNQILCLGVIQVNIGNNIEHILTKWIARTWTKELIFRFSLNGTGIHMIMKQAKNLYIQEIKVEKWNRRI